MYFTLTIHAVNTEKIRCFSPYLKKAKHDRFAFKTFILLLPVPEGHLPEKD